MTVFDSASLKYWESVADWGTRFVIIGVAGEGVELLVKCFESCVKKRQRWRHFFHKADPWINLVGGIFWIMVVLGLCAEFKGNHMAKVILDKDNAELHGLASVADERSRKLESENLELKKEVLELSGGMEARLITQIEKNRFIEALKTAPKGKVRFVTKTSNSAYKLLYYLPVYTGIIEAGYELPGKVETFTNDPPRISPKIDVVLYIHNWNDKPAQLNALDKAFDAISLKSQVEVLDKQIPFTVTTNEVIIYMVNPHFSHYSYP